MGDHDLNIDNYNLEDLLDLFKLDYNFDDKDLKQARKKCLMTHPDKSGLDQKYFLFYTKAYQMVEDIHHFRAKKREMSTDYTIEENEANQKIVDKIQENKNSFGRWFNEAFNKVKIKDESHDDGYDEWLRSDDNISSRKNVSFADFEKEFYKEKTNCKALVKRKDIEAVEVNSGGYDLVRERPDEYSSVDIFSKLKLKFEDLRKAHTETVIPITRDDFNSCPKFADLESYKKHRAATETEPMTIAESRRFISEKNDREGKHNVKRAFKILKQDEEIEKSHDQWWAYIRKLEDR